MLGGGVYDHVTAVIGWHGDHKIGKLPIARSIWELFPLAAGSVQGVRFSAQLCPLIGAQIVSLSAQLLRGRIFAYCRRLRVKVLTRAWGSSTVLPQLVLLTSAGPQCRHLGYGFKEAMAGSPVCAVLQCVPGG